MPRLVLGSRNKKKLKEMLDLRGDLNLDLTDLTPYPDAPPVEETAGSFVGNATLKATQLAPVLGTWVIGEDSSDGSLWGRRLRAWVRADLAPRLPR